MLTLYNLSINSNGLGRHGYFHWRTHISLFIEKNWNNLLESYVLVVGILVDNRNVLKFMFFIFRKKRKTWTGTISGTLSHNTPDLFLSGQELFHEAGWWKLSHNITPKEYFDLCKDLLPLVSLY